LRERIVDGGDPVLRVAVKADRAGGDVVRVPVFNARVPDDDLVTGALFDAGEAGFGASSSISD